MIMGLVLSASVPVIQVRADDTEDLLNVYGLTLGGPIKSEIENRMQALESEMNAILQTAETQQKLNDEYNITMQKYVETREELIDNILVDVDVYQHQNNEISDSIAGELLDGDIESLLNYDALYKTNTSYVNDLLSSINDYKLDYTYRYIQVDVSDIEEKLSQQRTLYIESLDTYQLGNVKNLRWVMDNDRYVTSKYGYRIDPLNKSNVRFHAGTDYRAPVGTEVYSMFNGEVIDCGWSDTIGYYVTVQSGENVKFLVCHLSKILVEKGQPVDQYDVLALSGATGSRCTGPHLHLALYLNGVTYDVDRLFQ